MDAFGEFAKRIHGSSDLFETSGRGPSCSVNFITSHDGFTLQDLVSYEHRHNHANAQENRDGHGHNFSCNHGVEGESEDPKVQERRSRHRLNLLATLLFSQGTPMLLAGDEFGNTQGGNNNAYAQDNETGWLDWQLLPRNATFLDAFRELIRVRRSLPLLRMPRYVHGRSQNGAEACDIQWLTPGGKPMQPADWHEAKQVTLLLERGSKSPDSAAIVEAVAMFFNASDENARFTLPRLEHETGWKNRFCSSASAPLALDACSWQVERWTITLAEAPALLRRVETVTR